MTVGKHLLVDLHCKRFLPLLTQIKALEGLIVQSAQEAGATVLGDRNTFHSFGPELGVTGVVVLAESHVSIHTWPELGFAAIDIFMCGETANPDKMIPMLVENFHPIKMTIKTIERGE